MIIKCVASISPVIWNWEKKTTTSQQGFQQFDIPPPSIDTREAMFLGRFLFENSWEDIHFLFSVKSNAITFNASSIILLLLCFAIT